MRFWMHCWLGVWVGLCAVTHAEDRTLHVQAHRGASAIVMENTVASLLRAVELGANSIELDVSLTRDGKVVVFHNFQVGPESVKGKTQTVPVHSLSLKELQSLELTLTQRLAEKDTLAPEQKTMPSLREVFEAIRASPHPNARKVVIDVELKSHPDHPEFGPAPKEYVAKVLKEIQKYGPKGRVAIRSFDHRLLVEGAKKAPAIPRVALTQEGYLGFGGNYSQVVAAIRPSIIAPYIGDVTPEKVEQIHEGKAKVIPWAKADKVADWERAVAAGVDGLTVDDPTKLTTWMKTQNISQPQGSGAAYRCGLDRLKGDVTPPPKNTPELF